MEVLVIGGTRFLGKKIVNRLLETGHTVTVISRGNSAPEFSKDVEWIISDRRDCDHFSRLLEHRHFAAVIDNAAYTGRDVESAISAIGQRIDHYILCSSGAVYSGRLSALDCNRITEDQADLAMPLERPYAEGKRTAENALWSLPRKACPFAFTIMRPAAIEGPEDPLGRTWFWTQRLDDGQEVLVPDTAENVMLKHAYVDDVAEAFVRSLANPITFYKAYNLANNEVVKFDTYLAAIASVLGSEMEIVKADLNWIRSQDNLANFEAPFADRSILLDSQSVLHDLKLGFTPFDSWLRVAVTWSMKFYCRTSSAGYEHRRAEVAAARSWKQKSK